MEAEAGAESVRNSLEIVRVAGHDEIAPGHRTDNDRRVDNVGHTGACARDTDRTGPKFIETLDSTTTQQSGELRLRPTSPACASTVTGTTGRSPR